MGAVAALTAPFTRALGDIRADFAVGGKGVAAAAEALDRLRKAAVGAGGDMYDAVQDMGREIADVRNASRALDDARAAARIRRADKARSRVKEMIESECGWSMTLLLHLVVLPHGGHAAGHGCLFDWLLEALYIFCVVASSRAKLLNVHW